MKYRPSSFLVLPCVLAGERVVAAEFGRTRYRHPMQGVHRGVSCGISGDELDTDNHQGKSQQELPERSWFSCETMATEPKSKW